MKKIFIAILNICICIVVLTTSVYAWYNGFFGLKTTDDIYLSSNSAYFDSGEGTKESPYIITDARHLYNLAWLQNLGFFDEDDDSDLSTPAIDRFYFKLGNNIDMSLLKRNNIVSPIPPIGIKEHPFVSDFDGSGFTINNLTIDVNFDVSKGYLQPEQAILSEHPESIQSNIIKTDGVGTFGVIGKPVVSGSTEKKAEYVQNFYLDNTIVKSSIEASVGVVAGIVNSNIKQIGVHYSSLQLNGATPITDQKMSDFALIGRYDAESGNWADRAGMIENFIFDADKIGNHGDTLGSRVDYNDTNKTHTAYNRGVFNLIGEMKITSIAADVNKGFTQTYEYDGQSYTYTASNEVKSIQFQKGLDGASLRPDRQLRFHADGKGKIFFAVAGNGSKKVIEVYKSNTIDSNFTSANGAHVLTDEDVSKFTALDTKIETSAIQHELTWGSIDITEKGDYVFVSQDGNTYLAYLHFIIANNQGNTGGDNAAYAIDKVDFIYMDPATNQFIPFDENYKSSFVSFEIISGSGNIYFRRNKDSGTNNTDVVLFYPNTTSSSLEFKYYSTGNKGVATDQTCETLSGDIITGGAGGGGGSGPVVTKHTVTFKDGPDILTTQSVVKGSTASNYTPTKEGYQFIGWYTDSECTAAYDFANAVNGDLVLYSKWEASSVEEFTVTFDSQQGSSVPTQNIQAGGKVTKPTDPTRDGYTFGGWYKEVACTTAWDFDTDTVTENTTLYAKWSSASSSTTVIYDFSSIPADSGITYVGSTSTSKGTVTYNGNTYKTCLKMESSTSITIKMEYDCTITLVFDVAGSTFKLDGNKITLDSNGQYTLTITAGTTYTITKGDTINLFLIVVAK